MSIRGRGITMFGRGRGPVVRLDDWRSAPVHAPRLKASASRVTKKLMRPGSTWARHGERVAYIRSVRDRAWPMVEYLGVRPDTAIRIAMLGLTWEQVCCPLSDPHVCLAESFERGETTLAELHGTATLGESKRRWGGAERVAGMPPDAAPDPAPIASVDDVLRGWTDRVELLRERVR